MKKLIYIFLLLPILTFGQVPQGFTYQAVATDNNGLELVEQNVSVRVSILSESSTGVEQWIEVHSTTTDGFGLFTITIGEGTSTGNGVQSSFSDIDWGGSEHYLKIEMDVNGSSEYQLLGTSQLMSVPYALHAGASDQGDSQSEQIDSLETVIQQLTNTVNSVSSGITSTNSNGNVVSLCDIGYSGDTIIELGQGEYFYVEEVDVDQNGNIYVLYNVSAGIEDQGEIYNVNPIYGSAHYILVKYNANGEVVWQRTSNSNSAPFVNMIINDNKIYLGFRDGGFYFMEDFSQQIESNKNGILTLSIDGVVENVYNEGQNQTIYDFAVSTDNIYIITHSGSPQTNLSMKNINTFESILDVSLNQSYWHEFNIAYNFSNDKIYVFSSGQGSTNENPGVTCYTSDMNQLWNFSSNRDGNFENLQTENIFLGADLIFYLRPEYGNNPNELTTFYKLTDSGELEWSFESFSARVEYSNSYQSPSVKFITNNENSIITYNYPDNGSWLTEYEFNDLLYLGKNKIKTTINSDGLTTVFSEISNLKDYAFGQNFLLEMINQEKYFTLVLPENKFCFNNQIFPADKLYLMIQSF